MEILEISPQFRDLFSTAGLSSFADFMKKELGHTMSREQTRSMVRISLDGRTFYLKRMHRQTLANSLWILCTGEKPHGTAYREMLHVQELRKAGFDAMEVAAAGEFRRLGMPGESFLMTHAVEGEDLDPFYRSAPGAQQKEIARRFGELLGKLHASGFYSRVRLKDVLIGPGNALADRPFTLIDRETRHPYPRAFSRRKSISLLAAAASRHHRMGIDVRPEVVKYFLSGYVVGVSGRWNVGRLAVFRLCREKLHGSGPNRDS
jgi:hypothetical protein